MTIKHKTVSGILVLGLMALLLSACAQAPPAALLEPPETETETVDEYVPVLMYHKVAPEETYYHNSAEFEEQLKWLQENNFTSLSLDTYADYINGRTPEEDLPHNPILITFDDGDKSVYEHAFPILQKYGMKFTIFLIGDSVGNSGYIDWGQVREMVQSGLCSLGSHTADMHNFVLTSPDGDVYGALASHIWQDDGIYAYKNQAEEYGNESYFLLPVAGTARNHDNNELYPVESYLGFYADKTITVDRIILRTSVHIPAETYYDVNVKVSLGPQLSSHQSGRETVVNGQWQPKAEPIDLYDENEDSTWPIGRYDVIYFDQPYTLTEDTWYNLHLETLNIDSKESQFCIYTIPSLPFEQKNCATNSQSSDYAVIDGWAEHHALPILIASDGTGKFESNSEYKRRVEADLSRSKAQIEKYVSPSFQPVYKEVKKIGNGDFVTAIPFFGASKVVVANPEEAGDYIIGPFERNTTNLKVEFDSTFQSNGIQVQPVSFFGTPYTALVDVYIGPWEDGDPTDFVKVKQGFVLQGTWNSYQGVLDITFDDDIVYAFSKDVAYCVRFETKNQFIDREAEPLEGVFRIAGDWIENEQGYNAFWNSRAGDGIGDGCVYANVDAEIKFLVKDDSGVEYDNPVWGLAFPFGMYTEELQDIALKQGFEVQFTVLAPFSQDVRPVELNRVSMVRKMDDIEGILRKFGNLEITKPYPHPQD